jgi:hypothetical protein
MGDFSEKIAQKSDLELKEIGDSILDYQTLFIIDYFSELDERDLLFDYKIFISNDKLIRITHKIKNISDNKYFNLLLKEINIRKITIQYDQFLKDESPEGVKGKNKKWYSKLVRNVEIFLLACLIIGWVLKKNGVLFKSKEANEHEINYTIPPYKHTLQNTLTPSIKFENNNLNEENLNNTSQKNEINIQNKSFDIDAILSEKLNKKGSKSLFQFNKNTNNSSFLDDPKIKEMIINLEKDENNFLYNNPRFQLNYKQSKDTNLNNR